MTALTIEMITASLRSCTLGRTGRSLVSPSSPPSSVATASTEPHLLEVSDESPGEVMVDLNSEAALPCHWEQCLDMRSNYFPRQTGQVYYVNWDNTGTTRTTKDPPTAVAAAAAYSSIYQSGEDDCSSDDSCTGVESWDDNESSVDTSADSSCVSSLSASSPPDHNAVESVGTDVQILVAAGCRSCFMYFMVPKTSDSCPKCGGGLLHVGR